LLPNMLNRPLLVRQFCFQTHELPYPI